MSAYSDTPLETLRAWLTEALQARQRQMVGPTSASSKDRRVAFDRAKGDLDAYVAELRREIERRESPAAGGPITIGF